MNSPVTNSPVTNSPVINSIVVLGSTGSIGHQTLELVRKNPDKLKVEAIAANSNISLVLQQAKEFRPKYIALADVASARAVQAELGQGCQVFSGEDAICEMISTVESEVIIVAVLGFAALKPVITALELGKKLALANKECLVAGGPLINQLLRRSSGRIIPVDSEHSSLYQLLAARNSRALTKLTLTASGGPFLKFTAAELAKVTPEQAVKHPRWSMGAKISVDSATLMNKGLEVIEAVQLFGLPIDKVDVLVHPESLVHGLIEYDDGAIFACCFSSDMRLPIAYAISELLGDRVPPGIDRLDLAAWKTLNFERPDLERFPALRLAYESMRTGESAPAVLNGANEIAVSEFLVGRLRFVSIPAVVEEVLSRHTTVSVDSLETILSVDRWARETAKEVIPKLK